MEELKPCPFCGEQPLTLNGNAFCLSSDCCGGMLQFPIAAWNRRPLSAEQTGGWRPIESAPRDGAWILVYDRGPVIQARWGGNFHNAWVTAGHGFADHATHWMPLPPAPPVVDDKTGKEGT